MKRLAAIFLLLFFISSVASAGIFIYEPTDDLTVFDEVVTLRGVVRYLETLSVNNVPLEFAANGSFSCGLALYPGKNLVKLVAKGTDREEEVKEIRVLKLKTFPDMEELYEGEKHWARDPIIYLASLGFIEGYPDGNFYPSNPITRGELATWIARVKELKLPTLTEDVFFDVPKEHWRAPYVKAVVDTGDMKGYSQELFGIDDPITRREAAKIAVISQDIQDVGKVARFFVDVPMEESGAVPIYKAREKGLVKGVSKEIPVYDPDRAMTRAEAAVLLARFSESLYSAHYLFNFTEGYSGDKFCRLNVAPKILAFTAEPKEIKAGQKIVMRLKLAIASRDGFFPVSLAKVNLSQIGGLPDTEMFDDGTHGDRDKDDGIYSLNISLTPQGNGEKFLGAAVIDRLGWESEKQTSLLIVE